MTIHNNPAGRLHEVLNKLQETNGGNTIGVAWADALGVGRGDLPTLTSRVGQVFALPEQIERELQWLDHYHPYLVAWRPALANLFANTNFAAKWEIISGHLTPAIISGVEACAIQLSRFAPEPQLAEDVLEGLRREVFELYSVVRDADIEVELKRFILRHLSSISDAIDTADVNGVVSIEMEMKAVVAEVAINPELKERIEASDKGRDLWSLLSKYLVIFGVATSPLQFLQLVKSAHPALPTPSVVVEATVIDEDKALPASLLPPKATSSDSDEVGKCDDGESEKDSRQN